MALRYDNMSVPETFKSIYQSVQTFVETAYQVGKTGVIVAYTFVWGLLLMLWNTLESFADFLGASANFVISNIVIIILISVGLVVYRSRGTSAIKHVPKRVD